VNRWKANQSAPVDGTISVDQAELRWLMFLREELKDLSLLPEVVRHWKMTGAGSVKASSVDDAVNEYITYRKSNTVNKRNLNDICWRLREFGREFNERQMHEITESEISDYLETKTAGWSRKSQYKRITQFFGWARKRSLVSVDPSETITAPEVKYYAPEIYTIESVAALLEEAEMNNKAIFPYIALSAFGFLRQAELIREFSNQSVLDWSDFNWKTKTITVSAEVAKNTGRKTGDQRFIEMGDNLIEFLRPYARKAGPVVEPHHRKFYGLYNECHGAAEVDLVANGLRHSCLSYFIAAHPQVGIAQAAIMAGNSEAVARRHYIKDITKEEGEKYWGMRRG
jgi:integrase